MAKTGLGSSPFRLPFIGMASQLLHWGIIVAATFFCEQRLMLQTDQITYLAE